MEDGNPPKYGVKSTFIQAGLCIIASIAQLSSGMNMGFSAVTLPYLQQHTSYVYLTRDQASWFAGLATISIPFGCLISGPILDRWGRKTGLLLVNLPSFIGWLLIGVQPNLTRIFVGRILTGFASGLSSVPATVYFAEISTKSMRGLLINGTSVSIACGVLIVYTLGFFLKDDWRMVAMISSAFPLTAAVLIAVLVPESPQWLLSKGLNNKARKSLKKIRGVEKPKDVQKELDLMLDPNKNHSNRAMTFKEICCSFAKPQVYKPLIIMNFFFFFQQFSGIFVIIFYAVEVVRNSGITINAFIVSIIIAVIRLVFTVLGSVLSKHYGRRPLAIFSGIGMVVSLFVLVYHLNYQSSITGMSTLNVTVNNSIKTNASSILTETAEISWLPIISLLVYVSSSTIGFLTLPWGMIGEVFPSQIRGVAGGLTTCFAYVASFVTIKSYPYLLKMFNQSGVYTIFGVMAFVGTIFIILFLPETQGKTLKQIEVYFSKSSKTKKTKLDKEDPLENTLRLSSIKRPQIVT